MNTPLWDYVSVPMNIIDITRITFTVFFYIWRMQTLDEIATIATHEKDVIDAYPQETYNTFIRLRIMGSFIIFFDLIRFQYLCRVFDKLGQLIYLIYACLDNIKLFFLMYGLFVIVFALQGYLMGVIVQTGNVDSPFDRDDYPTEYSQWLWVFLDTFRTSFGNIVIQDTSLWIRRGEMLPECSLENDPS